MSNNDVQVQRVLRVFSNKTEELIAEYPLASFNLPAFKQHFGIADSYDPWMYYVYPVTPNDVEFISQYLVENIFYDFNENAYFVESDAVERLGEFDSEIGAQTRSPDPTKSVEP